MLIIFPFPPCNILDSKSFIRSFCANKSLILLEVCQFCIELLSSLLRVGNCVCTCYNKNTKMSLQTYKKIPSLPGKSSKIHSISPIIIIILPFSLAEVVDISDALEFDSQISLDLSVYLDLCVEIVDGFLSSWDEIIIEIVSQNHIKRKIVVLLSLVDILRLLHCIQQRLESVNKVLSITLCKDLS
jgi:hypothetical protein